MRTCRGSWNFITNCWNVITVVVNLHHHSVQSLLVFLGCGLDARWKDP
jgi:hypothetical protein